MHVILLPFTKETDNEVALEFLVKNLREEIKVGYKCSLENNGDVGSVEQLNWIRLLISLHLSATDGDLHSETLLSKVKINSNVL